MIMRRSTHFGLAMAMVGALALGGCASAPVQVPEVKTEVVTALVEVSTPCIEHKPAEAVYRWGVGPPPATDKEKVAVLLADYEQARQRDTQWQAATAGCEVKP